MSFRYPFDHGWCGVCEKPIERGQRVRSNPDKTCDRGFIHDDCSDLLDPPEAT